MDTFIIRRVKKSPLSSKERAACVFFRGDFNQRKRSQIVDVTALNPSAHKYTCLARGVLCAGNQRMRFECTGTFQWD